MKVQKLLLLLYLSYFSFSLSAQFSDIKISIVPAVEIPIGPSSSTGDKLFTFGGTISLKGEVPFSPDSLLFGVGEIDYSFINTTADKTLSLLVAGLGLGIHWKPFERFNFKFSTFCLPFLLD